MDAAYPEEGQPLLKTAVLIDTAGFPAEACDLLFSALSRYGYPAVKRAFGNWSKPELKPWAERLASNAIVPAQRFDYVPSSNSDVDITIEALDLLKSRQIEAFALASSSAALSRLAVRLREEGAFIFGFGPAEAANGPFRAACNYYRSVEELQDPSSPEELPAAPEENIPPLWSGAEEAPYQVSPETEPSFQENQAQSLSQFKELLKKAVAENENEDGWALLSSVGSSIKAMFPAFNPGELGYKALKPLVEETSRDIVRVNTTSPCKVRLLDDFS
jgi:hypothetical protein